MSLKGIGGLMGQLGMDASQWDEAMLKMQNDLVRTERAGESAFKRIGASLDRAAAQMERVGRTLTQRVTMPLIGLGGLAVREFGNFDAAMTQSLAIMGDVSSSMRGEMETAARQIGKTMSMSATEAAQSYFYLASAGLTAEQAVAALPQVAMFAQAGMFDMALATDLATDAQSALGLTVNDAQENLTNLTKVTDVLVKSNNLANATVQQFSEALTTEAGAALKTFNKDMEEGVAVLAAFADQGVKGGTAGGALSRMMRLLAAASVNSKDELKALGLEILDANGNMRNFADIIQNMEESLDGMSDAQRTAALQSIGFSARVQGVILPLLGTSDAIRRYEKGLRSAGGTTKEVSDKQMGAFNMQLKLLWDNVRDIGIAFGKTLEPALRRLITWTRGVVDSLQEMDHEARVRVIGMAALFAASGPLLLALAKAMRVIVAFTMVVTSKFGLIVIAFGSGVIAGQYLYDNWEKIFDRIAILFHNLVRNAWNMAASVVQANKWMIETLANMTPDAMLLKLFGVDKGAMITAGLGLDDALEFFKEKFLDTEKAMLEIMARINNDVGLGTLSESLGNLRDTLMSLTGADEALANFYALFEGSAAAAEASAEVLEEYAGRVEGTNRRVRESWEDTIKRIGKGFMETVEVMEPPIKEMVDISQQMEAQIIGAVVNMTEAFFDGVAKMAFASGSMKDVWKSLLGTLADLAVEVGKIAIGTGLAVSGIVKALKSLNPAAAIAAGIALVALGTGVRAALSAAADRGSSGGVSAESFQPSLRSEPMGFPNTEDMNKEVVFKIGRNQLLGVLQQGGVLDSRIGRRIELGG